MTERPDLEDADDASHEAIASDEESRALPADAPEADVIEQHQSAGDDHERGASVLPADVPEADALEQAADVGDEDDYDR